MNRVITIKKNLWKSFKYDVSSEEKNILPMLDLCFILSGFNAKVDNIIFMNSALNTNQL